MIDMKNDMRWVEAVILNKNNNNTHYLALKKLINIFHTKWNNKVHGTIINSYRNYLRSLLRREFGR